MTKTRPSAPVHLIAGIVFAIVGMAFAAALSVTAPELSHDLLIAASDAPASPVQLVADTSSQVR